MSLKIKIGAIAREDLEERGHKPIQAVIELKARKSLDGSIMIFDHRDIDIVVMPPKRKIITFSKNEITDRIYDIQDRFFRFMESKGVTELGSIQSGNVFGSLEAKCLKSSNDNISELQTALYVIHEFLQEEKEYFDINDKFEKDLEQDLTDPDEDESTELGEIPHADQKGSIRPGYIYSPYGISSLYRFE